MASNIYKSLLTLILISGFLIPAQAMTPEEYCNVHSESGAPGSCSERGSCAVITTNIGTEECKKCSEGGCELIDCSECADED